MSGIPREARDPNSKEEEKQMESQGRLGIQTQKKKRNEWNPKGSKLGIQTQRRRETSGIPREARDPNSNEKKRNEWNPKGSSGTTSQRASWAFLAGKKSSSVLFLPPRTAGYGLRFPAPLFLSTIQSYELYISLCAGGEIHHYQAYVLRLKTYYRLQRR